MLSDKFVCRKRAKQNKLTILLEIMWKRHEVWGKATLIGVFFLMESLGRAACLQQQSRDTGPLNFTLQKRLLLQCLYPTNLWLWNTTIQGRPNY